jgi:anti-anti-sigma factor
MDVAAEGEGARFTVTVQRLPGAVVVLRLEGTLDRETEESFDRVIDEQLAGSPRLIIIDGERLRPAGPDGVHGLVRAAYLAGESDIGLCLVGVSAGGVASELVSSGWDELFEIYPTVEQALDELG